MGSTDEGSSHHARRRHGRTRVHASRSLARRRSTSSRCAPTVGARVPAIYCDFFREWGAIQT